MCGLPEPAEEDAQHRVGVGGGADRGAGVGTHPLLVDDDRGRQPFEYVDLGPRQRRHEALHEGAVGLVDQPLRLRGDRAEHQRALARAGDAGEHRQPALRDLDADVLEVVHARAVHADQIVAVGNVRRRRLRGPSSWPCSSCLHLSGGPAFAVSVGVAWLDPTSLRAVRPVLLCFGPWNPRFPATRPARRRGGPVGGARSGAEREVRGGRRTRGEAGVRGDPAAPLLPRPIDREDLDYVRDHGHLAGGPGRGSGGRHSAGAHRSCSSPRTLPSGSVTVATRRPPPTS